MNIKQSGEYLPEIFNVVKRSIEKIDEYYTPYVSINITPEFNLHEYFDRMDIVEIAIDIEKEFSINIDDDDIESWETAIDIYNSVIKNISK